MVVQSISMYVTCYSAKPVFMKRGGRKECQRIRENIKEAQFFAAQNFPHNCPSTIHRETHIIATANTTVVPATRDQLYHLKAQKLQLTCVDSYYRVTTRRDVDRARYWRPCNGACGEDCEVQSCPPTNVARLAYTFRQPLD